MVNHVALILDGNRRWGKKNGVTLFEAYRAGANALQEVILELISLEVACATLYGFSFENWNRSLVEISVIMMAFLDFLEKNRTFFFENNVRLKFIGDLSLFDPKVEACFLELEYQTRLHDTILVQLAVSYSGRSEILVAAQNSVKNNSSFESELWTYPSRDPELLIRTGGCKRLSGFMLWQVAYTELFFVDTLWPDFSRRDLGAIFDEYKNVIRNKGV